MAPLALGQRPLWFPLAVAALLRLVHVHMPLVGIHSWRQADTAAMARHFAEGGMVFWLPQIDWGGATPGFVEAEWPLYPYLVALLQRLLGVHDWIGRGLSVLCSVLTIWLVIRIGRRLVGEPAGWWGGLFLAVLPIPVYYGRTVQPEALMLALAALSMDRVLSWRATGRARDLAIAWLAFTACCLIKVLPLFWLGLPLAWWWGQREGWRALRRPLPWMALAGTLALLAGWYIHAHRLGESTGLSFGFWAGDTNRYSWASLLQFRYWGDLLLRISVRNLAVLGLPLLVLGFLTLGDLPDDERRRDVLGLPLGAVSVLLAGALAPESSLVHEYYQLPLMLFLCPLLGLGWVRLTRGRSGTLRASILLGLLVAVSLTVLTLDYWRVETQQAQELLPLARAIRRETAPGDPIVVVSGSDPTLLNLSRRRGWLTRPEKVTPESIEEWRARGATHIAGNVDRIASYESFPEGKTKQSLRGLLCDLSREATPQIDAAPSCQWPGGNYVIALPSTAKPAGG